MSMRTGRHPAKPFRGQDADKSKAPLDCNGLTLSTVDVRLTCGIFHLDLDILGFFFNDLMSNTRPGDGRHGSGER